MGKYLCHIDFSLCHACRAHLVRGRCRHLSILWLARIAWADPRVLVDIIHIPDDIDGIDTMEPIPISIFICGFMTFSATMIENNSYSTDCSKQDDCRIRLPDRKIMQALPGQDVPFYSVRLIARGTLDNRYPVEPIYIAMRSAICWLRRAAFAINLACQL